MPFVPGDVVSLKSGGPPMTVAAVKDESVECIWIGEEGELFREAIPAIALVKAEDADEEEEEEEEDREEDTDEEEDDDEEEATKRRRTKASR